MKTSNISNLGMQNALRTTIVQSQQELIVKQKEVTTGTYADVGNALGAGASRSLNLTRDVDRLDTILKSNAIVTQRLSSSQQSLTNISDNVQNALNSMIALSGSSEHTQLSVVRDSIEASFSSFTSTVNTSVNGEYVFSGTNTDVKPLKPYSSTSDAKTAFDAAFLAKFGFAQTDAQAANITASDMQDFLTNDVKPMFDDANWAANWSDASDTNMTSRINTNEVVETSTNANIQGFRDFAYGSMIAMELLDSPINADARAVVSSDVIANYGKAVTGIDGVRAQLGLPEQRVTISNESLEGQMKIVKTNLNNLQGVDPYEASTRINVLLQQVETSYNITARIQKLSLVNFL
jgi:flagellar hook-associated protein 3 FlgL